MDEALNFSRIPIPTRSITGPVGVAYDPVQNRVYWSDIYKKQVGTFMLIKVRETVSLFHKFDVTDSRR